MGRHFDGLVKMLNSKSASFEDRGFDARPYIKDIVDRSALFEIPVNSEEVLGLSGKENEDYNHYLRDFYDMGPQFGSRLLTPFPTTAIEDLQSIVVMDPIQKGGNEYLFVIGMNIKIDEDKCNDSDAIFLGRIKLLEMDENGSLLMGLGGSNMYSFQNGQRLEDIGVPSIELRNHYADQIMSYIYEDAFIMDPANFIIQKEQTQSRKADEKEKRKSPKKRKSRPTIMRPHYIVTDENETRDFFRENSREPNAAYPVRGHLRTLQSERYVNKRGQVIPIPQHFRGKGNIDAKNGYRYRLMLKYSPVDFSFLR